MSAQAEGGVAQEPDAADAGIVVPWDAREYDANFQIIVHAARGDASNTPIHHRAKVHCTELVTAYLADPALLTPGGRLSDAFRLMYRVCDLLPVEDATTGGAIALLEKQIASMGAVWTPTPVDRRETALVPVYLRLYTSDEGPDQSKLKKVSQLEAAPFE